MKLTTDNILKLNSILIDLIQELNKKDETIELGTALTKALSKLIDTQKEYENMKQNWYDVELKMYSTIERIEANTAEEAQEILEDTLNNESDYVDKLDTSDFYVGSVIQTGITSEYEEYINIHKKPLINKEES